LGERAHRLLAETAETGGDRSLDLAAVRGKPADEESAAAKPSFFFTLVEPPPSFIFFHRVRLRDESIIGAAKTQGNMPLQKS
jgi:hypothetical protein